MYENVSKPRSRKHPDRELQCGVCRRLSLWRRKAGGRRMPSRSDIDPSEVKPYLSAIILVDVVPGRTALCLSSEIKHPRSRRPGMDPTGLDVKEFVLYGKPEAGLAAYRYVDARASILLPRSYVTPDGWREGCGLSAAVG